MRKKTGFYSVIPPIIFGIILVFALGCSNKNTDTDSEVKYVKITSVNGTKNKLTETFTGVLKEIDEVKLSFRIAGPIDLFPVKEGQFVRKGELLARIDPRDYQLQYDATKAEYDQIISEVERYEKLYSKNNLTKNDYEKAISGKKQMAVKLNAMKNSLNDTRLLAPFDGYIQTLFVSNGEITDAGMPIVSMVNTSKLEIQSAIPANVYIKKNQLKDFYCTSSNYPGHKFPVTLTGINAKTGINKLYQMLLILNVPDNFLLAPGMNVLVHFSYKTDADTKLKIPLNACFERDNKTYVYKYENGRVVQTEVETGTVGLDNNVTITSGLQANDSIISAGLLSLKDGQHVKPL